MSNQSEQNRKELASTYVVQDRQNLEELERLKIQSQMLTKSMGGVLPEQPDPKVIRRVLDVGCGPGNWVIETAQAYPDMSLIGVDISNRMIEFAREQARIQQVSDRVEFHVMDTLRMLEFPNGFFDLVNLRLGVSFIRTWDWPKLLNEFQRVTQPGGLIRLTECDRAESNSPALEQLIDILVLAFYNAGHFFAQEKDGLTRELPHLLQKHGLEDVHTQEYILVYRSGTPEGQLFFEDMRHSFRTIRPFFQRWTRLPDNYDQLYQQAIQEMQQPGFVATWRYVTAWGKVVSTRWPSRLERDR